jgi:hypothetical protein
MSDAIENGNPYLGHNLDELLKSELRALGLRNQDALTVMAKHRDPFRLEKYRPEAEWFAAQVAKVPQLPIHVRGCHYAAIGSTKPDGTTYANTDANAQWIGDRPAKAGRWLGTVPFEAIYDRKNDAPRIIHFDPVDPRPVIRVADVELYLPDDLAPRAALDDFRGTQECKLVVFVEKGAPSSILLPIAERFGCDAYISDGEISDTLVYDIAARGAADGRHVVIFTLSDCDPAGYWMPSTIGRKLQALRHNWFPGLSFEIQPLGLLPKQVEAINAADPSNPLPSSPLKEGEKRADAWTETFGIAQVELDAIVLRPAVLRKLITDGMAPFFDPSLDRRVSEVRLEWEQHAQAALEEQLGEDVLDRLRAEVEAKVEEVAELVEEINGQLWVPTDGIALPDIPAIPEPVANGTPSPLASSDWGYVGLTRALQARAAYAKGGA